MASITAAEIRMYRMGTGDCFAIKFLAGKKTVLKFLIDAGAWSGSKDHLTPFVSNLKAYLGNYADVLVVTHEHKDHVHAFDVCEELFSDQSFKVGDIWMGWTEKDNNPTVKEWKERYGEKKKALGRASKKLKEVMKNADFKKQFAGSKDGDRMFAAREKFASVLNDFADLHLSLDETKNAYKDGLAGMEVVKNKIKHKSIRYFKPGSIIEDFGNASNLKVYVLGPPELHESIKKEAGGKGESYPHNDKLKEIDAFSAAILDVDDNLAGGSLLPFEDHFFEDINQPVKKKNRKKSSLDLVKSRYAKDDWRKIDYDWLFSAGSFALRMNGLTNNLSLALAIEVGDKVLLFPGDAEYGSWASWHGIKWRHKDGTKKDEKHFTEDLLNRTVFYKVAHHLSHNGTAQRLGLEMMKHKDLTAMATLDYGVINDGWTSTMPNRAIIKELLARTKGRLMIMNEEGLFYDPNNEIPLSEKIEDARSEMSAAERSKFEKNLVVTDPMYIQYTISL